MRCQYIYVLLLAILLIPIAVYFFPKIPERKEYITLYRGEDLMEIGKEYVKTTLLIGSDSGIYSAGMNGLGKPIWAGCGCHFPPMCQQVKESIEKNVRVEFTRKLHFYNTFSPSLKIYYPFNLSFKYDKCKISTNIECSNIKKFYEGFNVSVKDIIVSLKSKDLILLENFETNIRIRNRILYLYDLIKSQISGIESNAYFDCFSKGNSAAKYIESLDSYLKCKESVDVRIGCISKRACHPENLWCTVTITCYDYKSMLYTNYGNVPTPISFSIKFYRYMVNDYDTALCIYDCVKVINKTTGEIISIDCTKIEERHFPCICEYFKKIKKRDEKIENDKLKIYYNIIIKVCAKGYCCKICDPTDCCGKIRATCPSEKEIEDIVRRKT